MFRINAIHQIEMTSRCNLKCKYCPSHHLPRPKLDMSDDHYELSLAIAKLLYNKHRYDELNLAGIGESTMHPRFVHNVRRAREVLGNDIKIVLATNGVLVDDAMARAIAPYRPIVYVSLHQPVLARAGVKALRDAGILAGVSCDATVAPIDWAGQIKWDVDTPVTGSACTWVKPGRVMVMADGRVTRCCFDASGAGVIGHVENINDVLRLGTSPYKLCATCHLDVGVHKSVETAA